jgi:phosphatidylserine/phosphatidylglycerophosphate/cardiolipin synthase-like enzyme
MGDLRFKFDKALGEGLESTVKAHHKRRLKRIGWEKALDPSGPRLWADGDPPPRKGNSIEVLVDGAEAFPRLIEEMRAAKSHVYFAGWMLTLSFQLTRGEEPLVARDFFAQLAEEIDVRILLWGGAPLPPPFSPKRGDVREWADELTSGTKVKVGLDTKERPLHCHHEKIVVIDDETAFVGGIDMTTFGGDRFDTNDHPARSALGWHDVTTRLRGPIVRDVGEHFALRWFETTGERLPDPPQQPEQGGLDVQLIRTVPEKIYKSLPKGDFRILESYIRAIRSARKIIYLENQFLWSPLIVDELTRKLANPPADDFRVIAVLPAHPTTGDDDTRGQLAQLVEADDGAKRVLGCALYARAGAKADAIYVHAKVGIIDDQWLTIGSANLNNHSLFNDSEVNIVTCDGNLAEATRHRLWAEHLEVPIDKVKGDPTKVFDEMWWPIAVEQKQRRDAGMPMTARVSELPRVSKRARRLLGPLESLIVDG